jgi:chemotaxis protein MotB
MSTGEKARSTIVIKRIKKGGHGGHSAAWKIAYADFVTAMMAFFLLMWLLGSTTQGDLQGISDYFQSPMRVSQLGGSGAGDASSLIQGGGTNLTQSAGQVKNGENDSKKKSPQQLRKELEKIEKLDKQRMEALKGKLEAVLLGSDKLAEYKNQIRIEITPDGLRITIVDDFNRPMFALGSATVQPYMKEILHAIGQVLNEVENKVGLSGHTDSAQYSGGERGYSNWELSADRANASRRELITGGMATSKIVRVVGLADSNLYVKDDPKSALNRRISIIVLNKLAEERINKAEGDIDAAKASDIEAALPSAGTVAPMPATSAASVVGVR